MRWALLLLTGCGRLAFDPLDGDAGPQSRCTTFDFSSEAPWEIWTTAAAASTASIANGRVNIQLTPNLQGYAGVTTQMTYAFTGASVSVRVPTVTGPMNAESYLAVGTRMFDGYYVQYNSELVQFASVVSGSPSASAAMYRSDLHSYWRIAHDATTNMVSWATSPDRVEWTEHRVSAAANELLVDAVIEVAAGTYGTTAQPGMPTFDDLEICLAQ